MDYSFYTGLHIGLLMFTAGIGGQIIDAPLNVVAEVGQQVIFNCTIDSDQQNWIFSAKREDVAASSAQRIVILSCVVRSGFATDYAVDRPGNSSNKCNLIVKAATLQQAGVYTCAESASGPSVTLTVTEKLLNATYNTTEGVVVENDTVIVECMLNYNGSLSPAPTLRPFFYWTNSNGHNVSSSYDSTTDNTAVSQLTVIAGRQDITPFTCHVYFQLTPTTNIGSASITPTAGSSATTQTIEVLFGPSTPNVTSWIEVMITKGGPCDVIVLNCSSTGNPTPQYKWFDVQGSLKGEQHNLTSTDLNLNYTCKAYNTIRSEIQSSSSTYKLPATDNSTNNSYCTLDTTQTTANPIDLLTTILLAAILGGYGFLNIIATIAFLVYYNHKSNTMNDEHEISKFKNKAKLNARFPWLKRMLPCMNDCRGNVVCTFLWVKLFIWMSILIGIIVFPILVSIVNCSRKRKNSKEDSDIGMRKVDIDDSQEYTRSSATPSTAAHGDIDNPYETVGTVRFHPLQSSEDITSAKNNNSKDPKKVFYTKVNPNFNPGEEIERYSVSTP